MPPAPLGWYLYHCNSFYEENQILTNFVSAETRIILLVIFGFVCAKNNALFYCLRKNLSVSSERFFIRHYFEPWCFLMLHPLYGKDSKEVLTLFLNQEGDAISKSSTALN